jgi:hypothetical protein
LSNNLGWHSAPLSAHLHQVALRRHAGRTQSPAPLPEHQLLQTAPETADTGAPPPIDQAHILVPPDLAAAFLRHNLAGPARVWLLLRHLDTQGRGWLDVDVARARLTTKASALRICGWRHLRNLLQEGQGILWQQDGPAGAGGRIWLRKPARVAAALDLARVGGRTVALPLRKLLGGIGQVRAQLYAAFHSGRVGKRQKGTQQGVARPIARETIARLTGVPRRTQIAYEAQTGIEVRHNYAVGDRATEAALQERAWKQGSAFRFVDGKGQQGQENGTYVAWQMPNTYVGPHRQQSKQRTKRINADLADLRTQGGAGNGREQVAKRYFAHGAAAGRAYNREPGRDAYWPFCRSRNGHGLWFVLSEC